ncbi:MAG: hypothetical protein ACPGUZ_00145 [Holosporaceae bacterium]
MSALMIKAKKIASSLRMTCLLCCALGSLSFPVYGAPSVDSIAVTDKKVGKQKGMRARAKKVKDKLWTNPKNKIKQSRRKKSIEKLKSDMKALDKFRGKDDKLPPIHQKEYEQLQRKLDLKKESSKLSEDIESKGRREARRAEKGKVYELKKRGKTDERYEKALESEGFQTPKHEDSPTPAPYRSSSETPASDNPPSSAAASGTKSKLYPDLSVVDEYDEVKKNT